MKLKSPLKPSPLAFPFREASPIACLISPIIPSIHIDLYGFCLLFRAADFLALGFGGTWWYRSQPYGGLGTPWVHITLHEQLRGEEITEGKKQSGQSQIAFYYHRGILSQRDSLFFAFPSAHFSIKNALFLKFPAPWRTTLERKTKRWNLASFPCCHIFNLPNTHMPKHPHCCYHKLLPSVAFHFPLRISCYFSWSPVTPWVTWKSLRWRALT